MSLVSFSEITQKGTERRIFMSEKTQSAKDLAARLLQSKDLIKEVVLALAGSTRRDRQNACSLH